MGAHGARSNPLRVPPQTHTTALFCGLLDFDLFMSASLSACVDAGMNRYYLILAGVGISVGLSGSVFSLIYRTSDRSSIVGTYFGGKISLAYGLKGTSVGVFFRKPSPLSGAKGRLYWIGYPMGASFDISTAVMHIGRL
jgi:hypothetical protein